MLIGEILQVYYTTVKLVHPTIQAPAKVPAKIKCYAQIHFLKIYMPGDGLKDSQKIPKRKL